MRRAITPMRRQNLHKPARASSSRFDGPAVRFLLHGGDEHRTRGLSRMRRSRHTDQEIAFLLREAEHGTAIAAICAAARVSVGTFYRWRRRLGGLQPAGVARLGEAERENARLRAEVSALRHALLVHAPTAPRLRPDRELTTAVRATRPARCVRPLPLTAPATVPESAACCTAPLRDAAPWATRTTRSAPVAQLDRALPSEGGGPDASAC
jgi:putative transposase